MRRPVDCSNRPNRRLWLSSRRSATPSSANLTGGNCWQCGSARTLEHFSKDGQSQPDKAHQPGPRHKRQPEDYDSCRLGAHPVVSIHFTLQDRERGLSGTVNQMPRGLWFLQPAQARPSLPASSGGATRPRVGRAMGKGAWDAGSSRLSRGPCRADGRM